MQRSAGIAWENEPVNERSSKLSRIEGEGNEVSNSRSERFLLGDKAIRLVPILLVSFCY